MEKKLKLALIGEQGHSGCILKYDFVRHILYGEPCVVDAEETFELTRACLAARDFADQNRL